MWNKFQYVHSSVVKILCSESQRTGSLDLCLPVWSFGSVWQTCVFVFQHVRCEQLSKPRVSFIFWSVSLPCQIEHMTCLWQMPELSQYSTCVVLTASIQIKSFLDFTRGCPSDDEYGCLKQFQQIGLSFPLSIFSQHRELMMKKSIPTDWFFISLSPIFFLNP